MQIFEGFSIITSILKSVPIIFALYLIYLILKYKHPFINALKSAVSGTACLILLGFLGVFTGINIPINSANLSISALLGIPGVGIITILNTLFYV